MYLADPSNFNPNLKEQWTNLKNRTGVEEAGKLLTKDSVGAVQWFLFFVILGALILFALQARKHEMKKAGWSIGVAIAIAVIAYLILPALV